MQTFLPYPSFRRSAQSLDDKRLGKQRVEAKQIFDTLRRLSEDEENVPWGKHPAVLMWQGYEEALSDYYFQCVLEWCNRGFENNMDLDLIDLTGVDDWVEPPWLGDPLFHAAHRSNLLRKDSKFYGKFRWTEAPDRPYLWPVLDDNGGYTLRTTKCTK